MTVNEPDLIDRSLARTADNRSQPWPKERDDVARRYLALSEVRTMTPPPPIIDRLLYDHTVAMLYGPSGLGKSFLALDMALAIATGHPWQGRTTERRRVLYVATEGIESFHKRIAAWEPCLSG